MQEPDSSDVLTFLAGSFRSAWAVEFLCLLHSEPARIWTRDDLVSHLRASDLVVRQSVDALCAAGLVAPGDDGTVRYAVVPTLEPMVAAVERLYRSAPGTVRRAIVRGNSPSMTAFANAFKLRSED
jgi:hypothetical protein